MIFLLTLLIILIFYILHKTLTRAITTLPPGPPPLPLIGNLHQLRTAEHTHIYFHKLSKKYGPIIHLKLGQVPYLLISSPKLAKEVLKIQDSSFCTRAKTLGLQKLSYNGNDVGFAPYNEHWREMRKMSHIHLFSPKRFKSYRPIRDEEISRLITNIRSSSHASSAVNLSEMTLAQSCRFTARIALGKEYDENGSEMRKIHKILEGFQVLSNYFFVSDFFPALSWVDYLTGSIGRADVMIKELDSIYQELIDEHLDSRREKKREEEEDMLDVILRLKEENYSSIDITLDIIKALVMNIISAATETSPYAVVWTITSLIKAPKVMEKLQNEIRSVIGEKGKVDEDDLPKLPYLKAVVYEGLRLFPPGPLLIPRETIQKCVLDGYEIEPKTSVLVNVYAIGRDPEYWENPDEFLPERFLNSDIDVKGQDFGLIPFGSGRRTCLGMSMGLLNVKLMLANLLYNFDWELPKGICIKDLDTDHAPGVAVHNENDLLLVPKIYVY